ncbi:YoaH family protein [Candidatus Arsenophonus triatominarum]|uniref:YoaH family protein n=1 Tax=Candidatus Arsenophonus triatominarum TaxID=57911 RepID=UPI0007C53A2A|nr:YoaH family protein [Candidatus Arsenophonus triatominarum]
MFSDMLTLNHQEQQEAAERIHQLMADGMSSGEAIALVAKEIRAKHAVKKQTDNDLKLREITFFMLLHIVDMMDMPYTFNYTYF